MEPADKDASYLPSPVTPGGDFSFDRAAEQAALGSSATLGTLGKSGSEAAGSKSAWLLNVVFGGQRGGTPPIDRLASSTSTANASSFDLHASSVSITPDKVDATALPSPTETAAPLKAPSLVSMALKKTRQSLSAPAKKATGLLSTILAASGATSTTTDDAANGATTTNAAQPGTKEDAERNKRHRDVVGLLSGERRLSAAFSKKYALHALLGDGAFGFVMAGTRVGDGRQLAVKFIVRDKIPKENWIRSATLGMVPLEVHILCSLRHPGVIEYFDHFFEEEYVVLVTEHWGAEWTPSNPRLAPEHNPNLRVAAAKGCDETSPEANQSASPLLRLTPEQQREIAEHRKVSCDLFECIDAHTRMDEDVARFIFAQLAITVHYLHAQNVAHRDLKDENVVIDEKYRIKLVDFGSAAFIAQSRQQYFTKFNGTAHFASPEIAAGRAYRGPEAEVWALGVLLYTLVYGENPFANRTEIVKGEYRFPSTVNPLLANLIDRMLTYDEARRATMDEVIRHPWIRDHVRDIQQKCHLVSAESLAAPAKAASPVRDLFDSINTFPHRRSASLRSQCPSGGLAL